MKCKNCGAEMHIGNIISHSGFGPEVKWVCPKCSNTQYQFASEAFKENAQQGNLVVKDEWFNFKCQAAKDFVVGMLAHAHRYHPRDAEEKDWHKAIVEEGIEIADELVRQLKQS